MLDRTGGFYMIGAAIGIFFGLAQFALLFIAVRSIARQQFRLLPLIAQFFCPLVGLLLCVLVRREQLLTCAVCIISILLLGAVIELLVQRREKDK